MLKLIKFKLYQFYFWNIKWNVRELYRERKFAQEYKERGNRALYPNWKYIPYKAQYTGLLGWVCAKFKLVKG